MKLTFSSPLAPAEFSKFADILSAALSQHHLSGSGIAPLEFYHCWEPVRNSAHDKGHEEGGSAYANAGSSLRNPPGYSRAFPPQKYRSLPTVLLCALTSDFTGGWPPPPSRSLGQRVNLRLQFIKFLVILPFTLQLSLHLERGTHHAY